MITRAADKPTVTAQFASPDHATGEHTESDDAAFEDYQIVAAVGEDATLEDAVVLETRTNRVPAPFTVSLGLGEPGGAVSLWVIVRTKDGHEKASSEVVVVRPV